MKNYKNVKRRLRALFVLATAAVLLSAVVISIGIERLLEWLGILTEEKIESSWFVITVIFGTACTIIGISIALFVGKFVLSPVNELLDGMEKLSDGKYETRLDFGESKTMSPLAEGFNSLADELQHTEILRADFINNFSHEFKTPIVSIKGLVGLMKSGRASPEKQSEYLEIIDDETDRLAQMTTNILNLTKIENQAILPSKNSFNLSEQVRVALLLLERRWREKELELCMDFEEYRITANEDLLKQVWINLLDNAIKFSPDGGTLSVGITKTEEYIIVKIGNSGKEITESEREKLFHKFYQAENNISRAGNGIGLSIVKSIVELHGGEILISYENGMNVFSVKLRAE